MPINFSLNITGLCVIVLKSKQDDQPKNPEAVEILCVDAHHHRPAISYLPKSMAPVSKHSYISPELCVNPEGERIALWDISKKLVSFDFENKPANKFSLTWGPEKAKPNSAKPIESTWMNWIAPVDFLGLTGIRAGKDKYIPQGASARVLLPQGIIKAQEIIENPNGDIVEWGFYNGKFRALANRLVFSVKGAKSVNLLLNGEQVLSSKSTERHLSMSLSNDMTNVPYEYNQGVLELKHLTHLEGLAEPFKKVNPPKVEEKNRTGKPICNQVLFVDKS